MVKIVDKQTAFNTGIITNKLRARDDLKQYNNGVADAMNFIASKYGPIIKRTGTLYKYECGNAGEKVFLLPFVFSIKQSLILEFSNERIRFYTFDGADFRPIADPNDPTAPYVVDITLSDEQLENISYAQSLDVIYLAIPNHPPQELRRIKNDEWQLVNYDFEDGPYLDQNYDPSKKIKISNTETGEQTLTVTGFKLSQADVGRHVRFNHPDGSTLEDRWGWGVITSWTNDTTAKINVKQKAWSTDDTTEYRLGAWGPAQGWPALVTIHEQRLCWQGTTNFPWLWMSNSFNYHNFAPSDYNGNIEDSNAIYYNMATDKVAPVKWLASLGALIIGTEMYEMRMYSAGAGLAPGDCVVRKESTYGVHDALPVIMDDTLVFIQRLQRTLRSIAYDYARDAYVGPELSVLSESLTVPGLKKIVYQREPNSIIWGLLEDGTLLAITYDKEQDVVAWTKCAIAGKNAKVVDLVSIPSPGFRQDMLILWVEREVQGTVRRYVEVLSREFTDDQSLDKISYLDSAVHYNEKDENGDPVSATIISGLEHLEGETVRVMNRGGLHEDAEVVGGTVELQYPITNGWIGLPYDAYFETLERDIQEKQLSVKVAKVRIHKMVLYILKTLGLTVTQQSRGVTTQLITFTPKSYMDTPPVPYSGQKEHDVMTAWTGSDMTYTLLFESEPGLPCTVGGIYTGIEINAL